MELARLARAEDQPVCTELLAQALRDARAMRGGAVLAGPQTPEALLARWTALGPQGVLFVGEFHHAVVGLAAVAAFTRPGALESSGRVECCYVEGEARGVGVGSALMEVAVAWCTSAGCADVDALALPGDRATKQRLEAAGFTARLLTLSRRLD